MASERPPVRPRAITPFEPFDTHPKIAIAPRLLPRDPLLPGAKRDTDPHQLQDAVSGDDERTPTDVETPHEMILRKLNKLERAVEDSNVGSRRCYQLLIDLHTKLDTEKTERVELTNRVRALELGDRWVPRLAWLVTTAIALFALYRTYN